jgi:RNA polymerase sigma factor (sigma-70 family)
MMNFAAAQPGPEHPCCITPPGTQSDGQKPGTANRSLRAQIEALIPRLRRYAHAMARDPVAADDLVQDCLVRALGKIHLWKKGTDLRAWLFTILHNQCVSLARRAARQRDFIKLQQCNPGLALSPTQDCEARTSRSGARYRQDARRAAFGDSAGRTGGHELRGSRIGRQPTGRNGPLASFARPRNLAYDDRALPQSA